MNVGSDDEEENGNTVGITLDKELNDGNILGFSEGRRVLEGCIVGLELGSNVGSTVGAAEILGFIEGTFDGKNSTKS